MDVRKTRTCEKCATQVPLAKVKLFPRDAERNWMVCEECADKLQHPVPKKMNRPGRPVSQTPTAAQPAEDEDFISLSCDRCRYNFKINRFKAGSLHRISCPYCGKIDRLFHQGRPYKVRGI